MKVLRIFSMFAFLSLLMCGMHCTIGEHNPIEAEPEPVSQETIPVVTTRQAAEITYTSAKSGGEIALDLKNTILDRGVFWGTDDAPSVSGERTFNGTGPGNFSCFIDSLQPGTTYYIQAFATSNAGTGYGEIISFTTKSDSNIASIKDIDGNQYRIVKIGQQWWMAENLRAAHYQNGDPVPLIIENSAWTEQSIGACCYYDHDEANLATYGLLYNWHAVHDERNIAPAGWHVPGDEEWKTLERLLGMKDSEINIFNWRGINNEGGKLKSTTDDWHIPNEGAYDIYGFTALPAGYRSVNNGLYQDLAFKTIYWSSTIADQEGRAICRGLYHASQKIGRMQNYIKDGYSVRCVKD